MEVFLLLSNTSGILRVCKVTVAGNIPWLLALPRALGPTAIKTSQDLCRWTTEAQEVNEHHKRTPALVQ